MPSSVMTNQQDASGFSNGTHIDLSLPADGVDLLDTPGTESKRWPEGPETPMASRMGSRPRPSAVGTKGVTTLTLRDQEKHIDNLKKENFNIKLRVHFLEERLASLAPDQIDAALKQNINLKIEVQQRGMEVKKLKKLVLELERELDRIQRGAGGSRNRERELEERLEMRERELLELKERKKGGRAGSEEEDEEVVRELEMRNGELEEELDNMRGVLDDKLDEIERLREAMDRRGDDSLSDSAEQSLKRRMEELEYENEDLRTRVDDDKVIIAQKEEEREDFLDEINALRLEIEDLQRKRHAESIERSESRAQILEEREGREAVEDNLNALRDRLAALMIEMQQKEDELDLKNREIEELVEEHKHIVGVVDKEWRGEVEETRVQVDDLRDELAKKEAETGDLRLTITELEQKHEDTVHEMGIALSDLEREAEQKDAEIESLNDTIERLSEQIYVLEDEGDRLKEESEQTQTEHQAERERLEALTAALKEKISVLKSNLQEMTEMYETCNAEIHAHRTRQEELARHVEDLVEELEREREARERASSELEAADRDHETQIRTERRVLESKESALQSSLNDLTRSQSLLRQREIDLQAVQTALQTLETESKRAGETHTTTQFSLQLEADRLKRDLERVEEDLARTRKALHDQENRSKDRDGTVDKLHAENRDLSSQLAAQTQARLNLSEKLDGVQAGLRSAEGEVAAFKTRVAELEQRLSKDQRSLLSAENQYRDQLTERNTLLLTIYQYLDKILGVDKTPKKSGQAETKPFTNFGVFHDNLITRLKTLSQIQLEFDRRCKETEGRFTERMADMRKLLDNRWKQIDKFETSVKSYAETKVTWRRKLAAKEGELEAIKTTNAEMALQLSSLKRPGQATDSMEIRSLTTRAANAERRLNNAQNQLVATEERVAAMNQKNMAADAKWEARVKEYEARLRAAEERVKRERQGGKERVAELENNLKSLHRQLDLAQKRNQQLSDLVDLNKVPTPNSPGFPFATK